jgi:hypothetical protein
MEEIEGERRVRLNSETLREDHQSHLLIQGRRWFNSCFKIVIFADVALTEHEFVNV